MNKRTTRYLQNLSLIVFGTLIGLGFTELLLRNTVNIYECDAELGWTYQRDMTGVKLSRSGEFFNVVHFNSLGLRGRDYEKASDETQRILLLGDSFIGGLQVTAENHFASLVEQSLNAANGNESAFEVINAGVDGYGSAQQLLMFRRAAKQYKPDLTVLAVFLYTDLSDNSLKTGHQNHHLASTCGRPYFEADTNGTRQVFDVKTQDAENAHLMSTLFNWSTLYQILSPIEFEEPVFYQQDIFRRQFPEPMDESWKLTQKLIRTFADEVEKSGSQFAVLIVPHGVQVGQAVDTLNPVDHPQEKLDRSLILLRDFLETHEMPYISLAPTMKRENANNNKLYFDKDAHWNEEGHKVVANVFLDWMDMNCDALNLFEGNCEPYMFTNR